MMKEFFTQKVDSGLAFGIIFGGMGTIAGFAWLPIFPPAIITGNIIAKYLEYIPFVHFSEAMLFVSVVALNMVLWGCIWNWFSSIWRYIKNSLMGAASAGQKLGKSLVENTLKK